jgi:hypothetical protein
MFFRTGWKQWLSKKSHRSPGKYHKRKTSDVEPTATHSTFAAEAEAEADYQNFASAAAAAADQHVQQQQEQGPAEQQQQLVGEGSNESLGHLRRQLSPVK